MRDDVGGPDDSDARSRLVVGDRQRRMRRFWRSIPDAPRCKLCHRPFGGIGGPVMRLVGLGPWAGNPTYCRGCFRDLYRHRRGADVECTLVFADVRDSTSMAASMEPGVFRQRMERFYAAAFATFVRHDAFVDKFVGDEVIGIFVPAMTEGLHARSAMAAAIELLGVTGHGGEPWIPIGIGINSGVAYVGAVGTDEHVEFTALGDAVNVAARLATSAGKGEALVSVATLASASWSADGLERRRVMVKGKPEPIEVVGLTAASNVSTQGGDLGRLS